MLLPPTLQEWLPRDHPVCFIDEVVDHSIRYGYWRGIHSSRKLERALYEDVGFRVLSGNQ